MFGAKRGFVVRVYWLGRMGSRVLIGPIDKVVLRKNPVNKRLRNEKFTKRLLGCI